VQENAKFLTGVLTVLMLPICSGCTVLVKNIANMFPLVYKTIVTCKCVDSMNVVSSMLIF